MISSRSVLHGAVKLQPTFSNFITGPIRSAMWINGMDIATMRGNTLLNIQSRELQS